MEMQQGQPVPQVKAPRSTYLQLGVLLGVALVAFVATWFLMHGNGSSTHVTVPPVGKPAIVSEAQLKALAKETRFPVYWAGAKNGAYELTRTSGGRIYVRYLQSANELGTRSAKYLTVGTYPSKQAIVSLRRAAVRRGGLSLKIDKGGLLVFNTFAPTSVHFSYPKAPYQVEVYDPSPQVARTLVLSGAVKPIG